MAPASTNKKRTVIKIWTTGPSTRNLCPRNNDPGYANHREGELESGFKTQAEELGVGKRVHFIGRCTNVPALLAASYACVLTSTAEGYSNSILEYMAAGKPVIATNVGGAAEAIIEGKTGYLAASNDDAAMAMRLIKFLEDTGTAEKFGVAGAAEVRNRFSTTSQLEKNLELYNRLLNKTNAI